MSWYWYSLKLWKIRDRCSFERENFTFSILGMADDIFVVCFYIGRRFKLESCYPVSCIGTITSRHQSIHQNSTKDDWEI